MNRITIITMIISMCPASLAWSQSAQIPAPPQSQPIILHNGTIHTVGGGEIEKGFIRFEEGVIVEIGSVDDLDADGLGDRVQVFDASGLHVYPGLISSETTLGLTETGSVDVTQDSREIGDFTPEVRAVVAVNPDTDLIPVTRANGILIGLTFPEGGIVAGRCSAIRFDGWTWEDMTIDATVGMVINWPRTEPVNARWMRTSAAEQMKRIEENLSAIDDFFDHAENYTEAKAAEETFDTDLRYEAMRPVLEGEMPVFVRANSAGQIESAVSWAVERGLKVVIVGGSEANEAIPILRKHDVPVIIGGIHRLPSRRHDAYDAPFTLPNELYEAGVRFSIATAGEAPHERNLPYMAATAAAYGLPRHEALKSVTLSAADILGISDRYGSLDIGKSATLIVTTGDPLEVTTDTVMAFIDGRRIDLGSRHKRLYQKYMEKYRQLENAADGE
ncbi:MAG: amidohydrolase family protein [Phycisphaerales bacterium]